MHLFQPRLYDLLSQIRSLQQRLHDVNLDVQRDMENYKDNFSANIQTLYSLIQRANSGNLKSRVSELSSELAARERHQHEAGSYFTKK